MNGVIEVQAAHAVHAASSNTSTTERGIQNQAAHVVLKTERGIPTERGIQNQAAHAVHAASSNNPTTERGIQTESGIQNQ